MAVLNEALQAYHAASASETTAAAGAHFPLNQILFGPPGTGKTYNTVRRAVAIVEGQSLDEVETEDYAQVKRRYDDYLENGRIAFVTFHQSYGYEEFIEGIKPSVDGGDTVRYEIVSGVFKRFCEQASRTRTDVHGLLDDFLDEAIDSDPRKSFSLKNGNKFTIQTVKER